MNQEIEELRKRLAAAEERAQQAVDDALKMQEANILLAAENRKLLARVQQMAESEITS